MSKLGLLRAAGIVVALCTTAAIAAQAQTFTTLHSFDGTDGTYADSGLVQATNGNLYGATYLGGANGAGTVFKITTGGKLTTLYNFCSQSGCADGADPYAALIQDTNGNLYGTTEAGLSSSYGAVFKITPSGKLTTLYNFCSQSGCTDGAYPWAGLVQATNGNFYGATYEGGAYDEGAVFKITPSGELTTLHSFDGTDGAYPYAGLIQATNGNLYGTTSYGGANSGGTVFKITPSGTLTTLYSFCSQSGCTDGESPLAGLVQAADGNFYGTTYEGGAYDEGTVFKITPSGKLTTLQSFNGTDGYYPYAVLIQATDGNFYGTASLGGAYGDGTVFKITPSGKLTTLQSFNGTDGYYLYAGLVQHTNGTFYGMTSLGGDYGDGTVFSLSVGLGPFVETLPTSGKVGAAVIILGSNLTGTTGVSFNGTAATFTVVSSTEIKTNVPNGATTGTVTVTTPGGALNSNVIFRVTPQIKSFSPTSGPVGTPVTITGVSLTQTTKVTFGGVKATNFTVNSDTQVTAYVPTGAKTGHIAITTPGGTATSSGIFTVTQ